MKKVQGWGGQFHTNQCNILSKASLDHWDAGHASLTWHVYPSLSPDQSFLMHASTVSHARLWQHYFFVLYSQSNLSGRRQKGVREEIGGR